MSWWNALLAGMLGLGSLSFGTVIVEDDANKKITAVNKALGTASVTLDGIDLARDLDVSATLTYDGDVISDMVSEAFTRA